MSKGKIILGVAIGVGIMAGAAALLLFSAMCREIEKEEYYSFHEYDSCCD